MPSILSAYKSCKCGQPLNIRISKTILDNSSNATICVKDVANYLLVRWLIPLRTSILTRRPRSVW